MYKKFAKICAAALLAASSAFAAEPKHNLLSLSLGDLYAVARGDGRVDSPERIENAIGLWSKLYGCDMVLWRVDTVHLDYFDLCKVGYIAKHRKHLEEMVKKFNHHAAGREAAHKRGMKFLLNLSFNDGGWPQIVDGCKVMYAYQDKTLIAHPEYQEVDKRGVYHYGYLDLSNPAARKHMVERIAKYVKELKADGLYLNSRTHTGLYSMDKNYKNGPHHADRFGFGKNAVAEYKKRYGIDVLTDPRFDYTAKEFAPKSVEMENWRKLRGEYFLQFYREIKAAIGKDKILLHSLPLGQYMGSSGGNIYVDHEQIIKEKIGDGLVLGIASGYVPPAKQKSLGYLSSEARDANYNVPTFKQFTARYGELAKKHGVMLYNVQHYPYNKATKKSIADNPYHKCMTINDLTTQSLGIMADHPDFRPKKGVFSVEAIVNPADVFANGRIISKYDHRNPDSVQRGWELYLQKDKKTKEYHAYFRMYYRIPGKNLGTDEHLISNVTVPKNQWSHIGGTFDMNKGTLTVYVNGKAAGTKQLPKGAYMHPNTLVDVCIGSYSGYHQVPFAGLIDSVRISHAPIAETGKIPVYTGKEAGTKFFVRFDNTAKAIVEPEGAELEFTFPPTFTNGFNGRKALWFESDENKLQ